MLRPPSPPGDGRTYCEGQLQEVIRYILRGIIRAQKQGRPCFIAGATAAADLGMSRTTWYRYTRLLESAGQLRRTGNRGPAIGGGKNPGARYHFVSRPGPFGEHRPNFFLNSQPSESSTNLSLQERETRRKADLASSTLVSLENLSPKPPSLREEGFPRPVRSTAEVLALVSQQGGR